MPTATFSRLPEEKRRRIIDAAWEEFARVPFGDASVNQIIRSADIPRGSFYQYFENKEDLFRYLLYDAAQAMSTLSNAGWADGDIFDRFLAAFDTLCGYPEDVGNAVNKIRAVIRQNLSMDWQRVLGNFNLPPMDGCDFPGVKLEREGFLREDSEFVDAALRMASAITATSLVATVSMPESAAQNRSQLLVGLDILRRGSLKPSAIREKSDPCIAGERAIV